MPTREFINANRIISISDCESSVLAAIGFLKPMSRLLSGLQLYTLLAVWLLRSDQVGKLKPYPVESVLARYWILVDLLIITYLFGTEEPQS